MHPDIPLKYSFALRFKISRWPVQYIIRTETGVAKRYLRFRPICLRGYRTNAEKNPAQNEWFFNYEQFVPRLYFYGMNCLNHNISYAPSFKRIDVPSLKYSLMISNCLLTVSFVLISFMIMCSVF